MIYLGRNRFGKDIYLSYKTAGNIFIHGWPGSGKTTFIKAVLNKIKIQDGFKNISLLIWSFKPFDFYKDFDGFLYDNAKDFFHRIHELYKDSAHHKIIVIDELNVFLNQIDLNERKNFYQTLKNAKNEKASFICCSQHMHSLIKEFKKCSQTRICMSCFEAEEESEAMVGSTKAALLQNVGEMLVKNNIFFSQPIKTRICSEVVR